MFNQKLGLTLTPTGVALDAGSDHEVAPGVVHFAVLTTMAEVAAARAVGAAVVPAQVSVSLLARARPGRLRAEGAVVRRGSRLAVATGQVFAGPAEDEVLVAVATVTFALMT